MRLKDLLTGIRTLSYTAELSREITGVSDDSQKIQPGNVFVAVTGLQSDGKRYIEQAMSRGACCVVSAEVPEIDAPYVLVRCVRRALAIMARNYYGDPASRMTLVGITGTNGKTTTTYLIKHILETVFREKVGLIGTVVNMAGRRSEDAGRTTPDALQLQRLLRTMADEGCTHVIMEVSSHALQMERVYGLRFAVGVFTNLTQDHLDFHDSMVDYCAAKAKLFAQCDAVAYNMDDSLHEQVMQLAPQSRMSYGLRETADLCARNVLLTAAGTEYTMTYEGEELNVKVPIPGMFTVYNSLGALCACQMLGVPLQQGAQALRQYAGVKGRMEIVPTPGKDYTVIIDYAHTPDALENVLDAVGNFAQGRIIAVFGCGGDRDRGKRAQMGAVAARKADFIIVTDDNPRTELPQAIRNDIITGIPDGSHWREVAGREKAIYFALDHAKTGDVVVLCGKGHETYQEIHHEKHHLDEHEIVRAYIKNNK